MFAVRLVNYPMLNATKQTKIQSAGAIRRTLARMTHELIERNQGASDVILAGIRTRGIYLAHRIAQNIEHFEGAAVEVKEVDITPFRDDVERGAVAQNGQAIAYSNALTDRVVILVDDVIYTGRTVRSAMEALLIEGRPSEIQLAVLVDRGHRELPFRPDCVGFNVPTSRLQAVKVHLTEVDGKDDIELTDYK